MGFFDLNIPYYESDKHVFDKAARKTARLKLIVKAMELGYTGVAYNRTIKGVMSESDRCATLRFPLSSVLKLAPSLSAAVKLHRDCLNVPASAPFRQYTRLTVTVDSPSQASALNSGNPILKTYDVVAARPMNQNVFEQACQASEVDLISIDFSEKMPFRLKQRMVQAAIERGIYFEITYSPLIMDAQVRRQMISNAKLLVDWTRGKNLIFSSAAPSVTELRGPYDVANLSSLLGLSMEHAKAALSKNCRSLIAKALRKKQFYKEAIRVEAISSGGRFDSKESCFSDWLNWDPISSGEGDLLLDDMATSFSASVRVSKTLKAIDFASVVDSVPSYGLQVWDTKSAAEAAVQPLDSVKNLSAAEETEASIAVSGVSQQSESLDDLPKADQTSLCSMTSQHLTQSFEDSMKTFSTTDTLKDFSNEEVATCTTNNEEEPKNSNGLECCHLNQAKEPLLDLLQPKLSMPAGDLNFSPVYFARLATEMYHLQSQSCTTSCDVPVPLPDHDPTVHISATDTEIAAACTAVVDAENSASSKDTDFSVFQSEESNRSSSSQRVSATQDHAVEDVLIETNPKIKEGLSSISYGMSLHEDFMEREQFRETRNDSIMVAEGLPVLEFCHEMKDTDGHPLANCEPPDDEVAEVRKQIEDLAEIKYPRLDDSLGKGKVQPRKPRMHSRTFLFPLKRMLMNPPPFKRKAPKSKTKIKLL